MKIGFIGVGTMGRHMAANLIKSGFSLVVNDVRKEATNPHVKDGATWADTPKAVAEASDVVFTSLPGPVEVEAVALGHTGILAGTSPGKVYFDLSTNSPTVVRRIDAALATQLEGAEYANITVTLGFPPEDFHIRVFQTHGIVSGVRGTTVLLNRVTPENVHRISRYYWVQRINAQRSQS